MAHPVYPIHLKISFPKMYLQRSRFLCSWVTSCYQSVSQISTGCSINYKNKCSCQLIIYDNLNWNSRSGHEEEEEEEAETKLDLEQDDEDGEQNEGNVKGGLFYYFIFETGDESF